MTAPHPRADELDEERVAASPLDHLSEHVIGELTPVRLYRFPDRAGHVLAPDRTQVVALRPPEEGEHLVVHDVADGQGQAGTHEGELALFPEGVLQRRGELAELADLVPMNLFEGDEEPGTVLGEQAGGECRLVAQAGVGQMRFDGTPGRSARAERSGDASQPTSHGFGSKSLSRPGRCCRTSRSTNPGEAVSLMTTHPCSRARSSTAFSITVFPEPPAPV